MADRPGDTFVSKGIKYILRIGPKGNLRPYTVGPVKPSSGNSCVVIGTLIAAIGVAVIGSLLESDK